MFWDKKEAAFMARPLKCATVITVSDGFSAGAPIVLGRSMRRIAQYSVYHPRGLQRINSKIDPKETPNNVNFAK
jgi:hypothetical protein